MTYAEACAYIDTLPGFSGKHSIGALRERLDLLGAPDKRLSIIHVAGTNGKGSVCAQLAQILRMAGYHVGMFTSPHLTDIRERIRLDGELIPEGDFAKITGELIERMSGIGDGAATYFEFLLLIALMYYDRSAPDFVILECGLGGRLDPTNAVREPELSVITHLAMDHMQYLGETIEEIAAEKAGIIRPGVPVVYAADGDGSRVIEERAEELGAPLIPVRVGEVRPDSPVGDIAFSYKSRYDRYSVRLRTAAAYQVGNALLSIGAAEALREVVLPRRGIAPAGSRLSVEAIERGLYGTYWPGRMEELAPGLYVDGAHNADGVSAFLDSVRRIPCEGARSLVFGAAADKQVSEELELIKNSGLFERVVFAGYDSDRATAPQELKERYGSGAEAVPDAGSAYRLLRGLSSDGDLIFVAGSLYLIGEMIGYDKF